MEVIKYILISPYIAGCICLASVLFLRIKQDDITIPLGDLYWPLRYPLGVVAIDKGILTDKGFLLHGKVIRLVWWSIRFAVLGLLSGVAYALFTQ